MEITTLPPAILGTISGALDLIPDMQVERKRVLEQSHRLTHELISTGWVVSNTNSHIIPLLFSSENEMMKVAQALISKGILVTPYALLQFQEERLICA